MKIPNVFLVIIALTFGLMLIIAMDVRADAEGDDEEHCMFGSWGDGWWGFWMIPMMFGGVFVVIFVIILIFQQNKNQSQYSKKNSYKITEERYVRGEITREQFIQLNEDIKK